MDKDITTLLREIKAATGWSETLLASKLGVSQATVNRILHGQTECTGSTLRAIVLLHSETVGGPNDRRKTDRRVAKRRKKDQK